MRGKPRVFGIELSAERRSSGLRVVVRDDGAGVNLADVRARAVAKLPRLARDGARSQRRDAPQLLLFGARLHH